MYLALQHGGFIANYPVVPEDLNSGELPRPVLHPRDRRIGITTTSARLAQVRHDRRLTSDYPSPAQCAQELRRAETLYRSHGIPLINSSAKSVEEMSTVILQSLKNR